MAPGTATGQLAETVDIYPNLAELAGLPRSQGPQLIDGLNLVPVLRDPALRIRDHAYHAFPRNGRIGCALRTERYRLVEWIDPDDPSVESIFELYDYREDPLETRNYAADRPEVLAELRAILVRHPRAKGQVRR